MSNLARKNNETISKATAKSKGGKNAHALCQNAGSPTIQTTQAFVWTHINTD